MEKISFKLKEEERIVSLELEFEDESLVIKMTSPVAASMQNDKTISDMLKSMLRLNENKDYIFEKLINNLDNEYITELISTVLEKIQLKKKSINS